eukprot:CAMPEP_0180749732 /NCGR_PEP_ID=MMETSP1038_2-20121128/30746_1 /TAXON_ID=632150 /ORGANISM="Azadinium spinosum, Strain 3D9" /LENGTH=80 /DNA_ID=CAMNT_0022783451 /DNA_START=697 /DNA_END=935 /DNA_ORIENTATION=+
MTCTSGPPPSGSPPWPAPISNLCTMPKARGRKRGSRAGQRSANSRAVVGGAVHDAAAPAATKPAKVVLVHMTAEVKEARL